MGRKPQNSANLAAFLHIIDTSRLLGILRGDKTAIIHASSKAEQAFNYMIAFGADPAAASPSEASAEGDELLAEAA
ncbi:hypothetical protein [Sphingobium sp. CECT 9361]|uniref:hypothetical protein n=1 Tax=Sphingobium sp. CECT 9361 TaxID=2845384 RepID=UPI001E568D9F|nr:hypothetical protein [Sphingobium sp. CECT 9361]CAH0357350.1 hypothetical protein SPH9361_05000 [Sphingobium sp. CECT 9361]